MNYTVTVALRQRMAEYYLDEFVALRPDASVVAHASTEEEPTRLINEAVGSDEDVIVLDPWTLTKE